MMLAAAGLRFHSGSQIVPASTVHTTWLGYDRADIPVGAPLPLPASEELVDRLGSCTEVDMIFHGKLGDTLLSLAAVQALSDWLALRAAPMTMRAEGPHAPLIARSGLLTSAAAGSAGGQRAVIGDRAALEPHTPPAKAHLVCDPAGPPCWSSDGCAYPDLPTRHYLALERRLGIRLPHTAPCTPLLIAGRSDLVEQLRMTGWLQGLTIAAITATSWPERKDYTAERYLAVAEHIATAQHIPVRLLLIGGDTGEGVRIVTDPARNHVHVLRLDGVPADQLADIFPHCRLVVGNDTGLTHLAAMTRRRDGSGPPVIGLYARHSHSKWRTGLPHHHAIATNISHRMHQGDLCPVRDSIPSEDDFHMDAFPPDALAHACLDVLNGARA